MFREKGFPTDIHITHELSQKTPMRRKSPLQPLVQKSFGETVIEKRDYGKGNVA
ncbi:MAG TPA: hypothetical protein VKQ10_03920 [Spirochaetota bacterium]|jgi:hypothetical protein|nr:hypothetical protein [Spirochaetota bacterium]